MSPFEAQQATQQKKRKVARAIWAIALAVIALTSLDTWVTLATADDISAIQQAAGAGMGLFYAGVPYMVARGIGAMLRD